MEPRELENIILALLFASEEPLSVRRIAALLEDADGAAVHAAVDAIVERLKVDYPSIVLESVGGGLQLVTNRKYAEYVARLYSGKRKQRLSRAAMETLAIIAYKQPITRADVELLRGVGCGGVITTLLERSLIKIVGKAKVLGAPFLYGTSQEFLEYLGLNSLKDLPSMEELEALLEKEESSLTDTETVPVEEEDLLVGPAARISPFDVSPAARPASGGGDVDDVESEEMDAGGDERHETQLDGQDP
jgi:segregation and condensation protein B